jgi:hypothetical protein
VPRDRLGQAASLDERRCDDALSSLNRMEHEVRTEQRRTPQFGSTSTGAHFVTQRAYLLPSGEVRVLAETECNPLGQVGTGRGAVGTWQRDVIVFARGGQLYRVAVGGGTRRRVDLIPNQRHFFATPRLLPDARHLLLSIANGQEYTRLHSMVTVSREL